MARGWRQRWSESWRHHWKDDRKAFIGQVLVALLIGLFFVAPYLVVVSFTDPATVTSQTYWLWIGTVIVLGVAAYVIDFRVQPSLPRRRDLVTWISVLGAIATGVLADESIFAKEEDRLGLALSILSVAALFGILASLVGAWREADIHRTHAEKIEALETDHAEKIAKLKTAHKEKIKALKDTHAQAIASKDRQIRQLRADLEARRSAAAAKD